LYQGQTPAGREVEAVPLVPAHASSSTPPSEGQEGAGQLLGTFLTGKMKVKRKTKKKIII